MNKNTLFVSCRTNSVSRADTGRKQQGTADCGQGNCQSFIPHSSRLTSHSILSAIPRLFFLLLISVLFAPGCYTHRNTAVNARESFFQGDLSKASEILESQGNKKTSRSGASETNVCLLDQAVIDLINGNPKQAESRLRTVRDSFDFLEQKSLGEAGLSMLTDDNALSYAGEDYEKVMIRVFLTLSNLMSDGQDAKAYSYQISQKQNQIIQAGKNPKTGENPKALYKQVAVGAYFCGLLQERDAAGKSDAAYWYNLLNQWNPAFDPAQENLHRAQSGVHSQRGNGVVHVIALVGRGPYKEEVEEPVTQAALLIADQIVSATSKYTVPPTVAPVKVPLMVRYRYSPRAVGITVDGQKEFTTQTVTSVGQMALDQFEANKASIIGRAVARRIIKKGALYAAKSGMNLENRNDGDIASLALDIAGIAWEATESADTRCWGLLPDSIQAARIELPQGEHTLNLTAITGTEGFAAQGNAPASVTVSVRDAQDTYVLCCFPDSRLVGKVITK